MTQAGTRMHGTTREQPLRLYALERPLLRRLPRVAPDLGTLHRVVLHRDCHLQHDRAFYSAPFALAGKTLWLRATDTVVTLYEDDRHLATHVRPLRPGQRVTVADHLPPEARHYFKHDRRWCDTLSSEFRLTANKLSFSPAYVLVRATAIRGFAVVRLYRPGELRHRSLLSPPGPTLLTLETVGARSSTPGRRRSTPSWRQWQPTRSLPPKVHPYCQAGPGVLPLTFRVGSPIRAISPMSTVDRLPNAKPRRGDRRQAGLPGQVIARHER